MRKLFSIIAIVILNLTSCIDQIAVEPITNATDGILVVEANLDNSDNVQRIFLSRSRAVQSDSTVNVREDRLFNATSPFVSQNGLDVEPETNAMVELVISNGTTIVFNENESGIYIAPETFKAEPDLGYVLSIATVNGQKYESSSMTMPGASQIDSLYAERIISETGLDGIGVFVDSSSNSPANEEVYYRFSFEETYKIIAPNWTPFEFEIIRDEIEFVDSEPGILYPDVRLVPRAREEQVCFKTDPSLDILVFDTSSLNSSRLERNRLRFIGNNNPIISHRYSVLVKQHSVSLESYQFYQNLKNFNQSELVFSQIQPGPLVGNVFSVDENQPAIGFFDVSSVTEKRLYFNYRDFYRNEPLPPYFGTVNCDRTIVPVLENPDRDGPPPPPPASCPESLIPQIKQGLVEYYLGNSRPPGVCEGPYVVTFTICGDCNVVGSNIVPEFWIEE